MKSAKALSGDSAGNWCLFCGLLWIRRQTTKSGSLRSFFEIILTRIERTREHERPDGADKSGEERVERERADEAAVHEL